MRLYITADDYGLSAEGNAAIEDLATRGVLSAVSVMVHEGAHLDGLDRLREAGVMLGVHFVLTRERPLSRVAVDAMTDASGRLPRGWASLFTRVASRPHLVRAVRAELDAQLDRFRSLGGPPAFVNSHEHVHLFPPIWRQLAAMIAGAPRVAVRTARGQTLRRPRQALLALASRASWATCSAGDRLALSPLGIDDSGRIGIDALPDLFREARAVRPPAVAELVVHPASEHATLGSPEVSRLLAKHGLAVHRGALA